MSKQSERFLILGWVRLQITHALETLDLCDDHPTDLEQDLATDRIRAALEGARSEVKAARYAEQKMG